MPVIIFEGPKLSKEQKKKLVEKLTDAAVKATGVRKEAFIVLIKENSPDNVGVGGKLLTEKLAKKNNLNNSSN